MTEQMTNVLNKVNTVIRSPETLSMFLFIVNYTVIEIFFFPLDQLVSSTSSSQILNTSNNQTRKSMATVMPMVSGHTILSPKVNLPRVTVRQLVDMADSNHSDEADSSHEIPPDEVEYPDNVDVLHAIVV